MKIPMKLAVGICLLLTCLAGLVPAQTAMTSTTLSAALTASDRFLTVASATGITAQSFSSVTMLYIDKEAIRVKTVAGLVIGVERGSDGTRQASHLSGAKVFYGVPAAFSHQTPSGSCTSTLEPYLPRVVVETGVAWNCIDSFWVAYTGSYVNVGAANTGVTAAEFGDDRRHITKLTFTDLAIGNSGGLANLAIGKLLYTLPAGAIVVKAAYMSVALTGAGSAIDADTPDGGVGTVIGSGAVAVLGGTATFENMLTGQTIDNLTGTAEVKTVSDQVLVIEASAAHTVYFNLADGWAADAAITATGTVVLEWVLLQ